MLRWKALTVATACMCSGMLVCVRAGQTDAKPPALTALDYIEIRQLVDKYNWALDNCTNNGEEYARLFTSDGTFGRAKGHDQLAALSGGGANGCKDKKRVRGLDNEMHMVVNVIIEPTPEGATGKMYLVRIWPAKPPEFTGWFDDIYVKTPEGWRFKSRRETRSPAIQVGPPPAAQQPPAR